MALDLYLADKGVSLTVPLVDDTGNELTAAAVQYRITDQDGTVRVAQTAISTFASGDTEVKVDVPASVNTMAAGALREIRVVEFIVTLEDSGNTVVLTRSYGIESLDPLKIPERSFQSYAMAELMALDIPNIDAFAAATEEQRIAALMDAREHIVQLNFNLLNSNVNFGQDQLAYVPEGSFQSAYVARNSLFIFNGNLNLLNSTQFAALPDKFKRALRQAQIVEANAILGGESDERRRAIGLVEDEIGESRQKYRDGVPLKLPVCKRALGYLSYYVTFAKRIGRA